ncbi:MAG: hypothetical protein ABI067_03545 [Leifsonia sp.]
MIEIKITGQNHQEASNELLGFANLVAIGANVVQAQAAQNAAAQAAEPKAVEAPVKAEAKPTAKPAKAPAKKSEPAPAPVQADIEDVFDEEVVENVESDNPIPTNIDQLRDLVMKVHTKIGAVAGSDIVKNYAPKISGIPVEKYKDIAAELYAALED